jgi:hypothetical protein
MGNFVVSIPDNVRNILKNSIMIIISNLPINSKPSIFWILDLPGFLSQELYITDSQNVTLRESSNERASITVIVPISQVQ